MCNSPTGATEKQVVQVLQEEESELREDAEAIVTSV